MSRRIGTVKGAMPLAELAREASTVFSTAAFRRIMTEASDAHVEHTLFELGRQLKVQPWTSRKAIIDLAFDLISAQYRSEYYYKNLIATKLFVGRHKAARSALLHELKIGTSVADCVLVNGRGTVYEIKTEYDAPTKLAAQIQSYYKAFRFVNVVTHACDVDKYSKLLAETPVGMISVGSRNQLTQVKPAEEVRELLDIRTIFNLLRLNEITEILQQHYGETPDPPNGIRYSVFLSKAERIHPHRFNVMAEAALKRRGVRYSKALLQDKSLAPLRSVMTALDPTERQQQTLQMWLEEPIG